MKNSEGGFTLLEMAVSTSLVAMIALAATIFSFHALRTTQQTQDHLTAVSGVENAGYWISRDAYMADDVDAENLTSPTFLILKWTDWGYDTSSIYYSATYTVDNITGGIGRIYRRFQSSDGDDQTILVASNIYYDPADPANSTNVSYLSPTISLKVASRFGDYSEVREYQIDRRPNF